MLFKTNDLMRFLEIKHRYWKQFTTQLSKGAVNQIKGLFKSDHKAYLFKSFDQHSEQQTYIVNFLRPIFYTASSMQ